MRPTALVTGASGGIGRAITKALARDATVVALDRTFTDPLQAASRAVEVDVANAAAVMSAIGKVGAELGAIDWVVCAAGIIRDRVSWKMTDEEWSSVIDVNLTGVFNTARAVTPFLRKSSAGRLVFIGSINGTRGRFGQANYTAAKAGLVGLARTLALELARDQITVNVVSPGFIDTPMTRSLPADLQDRAVARTPLRRAGCPDDVAAAVRFLCSADAGFITGTVLPVDGGQLLGEVA
jgi:NAD(P)-dependent dehydrogenase (short-subunit alcohol dehydrogenase family)